MFRLRARLTKGRILDKLQNVLCLDLLFSSLGMMIEPTIMVFQRVKP